MKRFTGSTHILNVIMLAVLMTFTGCGGKHTGQEKPDPKTITYAVSERSDEDFAGYADQFLLQEDRLYFTATDVIFMDEEQQAADPEETVSRGERTILQHLYSANPDGSDCREIDLNLEDGQYLEGYDIAPDGSMVCVLTAYDTGSQNGRAVLLRRGVDGQEENRKDITDALNLKLDEDGMLNGIKTDLQGNILLMTGDTVYFFDRQFEPAGRVRAQAAQMAVIARTKDGNIVCGEAITQGDDYRIQAHLLDPETKQWGDSYPLPIASFADSQILTDGCGEYDFFYKNEEGIYGFRLDGEKEDKLMDFAFSGLYGRNRDSLIPDGKGGFVGASYEGEENLFHLTSYAKADASQTKERKMVTFATTWAGDAVEKAIVKFNRENKDYQIVLRDYSGEEKPRERMNMDITAGNIPDIIQIPEGMENRYAVDGLLEDLMPYLESDPELKKEDFLPSVFEAMQTEGELYSVTSAFELYSMAGRTSDVGENIGWNLDEFYRLLEKKGEDVRIFESDRKMDMLDSLLAVSLTDFVEWETGKCNFESKDFMDILKICDRFGSEGDQEDEDTSLYRSMHEGKVLLRDGLVDVEEFMTSPQIFGEDVTYIGYPNEDRQGTYFQFGSRIGMYAKSESKDAAWQFIRMFLTKELYQGEDSDILTENPVRLDCFDLMLEAQMAAEPYTNALGMEITPREGILDYNGFQIKAAPMTQEEADAYRELVRRTHKSGTYDGALMQIVEDEAKMYFAGDKSLEKTVEIIQERIRTYVNENR